MRISIEGVVSQLMNLKIRGGAAPRSGSDSENAKVRILSVSNASHMKVAQKPRGIARFRRYELVRVRNLAMEAPFLPPVSAGLFWCLVFGALLGTAQPSTLESAAYSALKLAFEIR